jgi:outer membrane receptor for ferrienterochelin and colicin
MAQWIRAAVGGALLAILPQTPAAAQATGTVSGRITDAENGQPIVAAQITIEGTTLGRATGDDGRFSITGVTAGNVTIVVRRIGYTRMSRVVTLRAGGTATADFALAKSTVSLTGVVVTATGEERKKEVGNAVTTVSSDEFARGAVSNTQEILQGRSTGVTVLGNSGQPGSGGTIRLRGVNSVTQGNRPLIYVDGVRIFNSNTPTGVSSRQSVSPLNDIDAADIDRVEIVKGPAATTLYGTEASGGVIQIFTKRGRDGKAVWSLETAGGINSMGDFGPRSDPTRMFLRECRGPNLVDINGNPFEDATCPSSGSWLQNGAVGRYSLGVRGSSGGINYSVSGNLNREAGVLRVGDNQTGGIRVNIGFSPIKNVTLALNTSYQRRNTSMISDGNSADGFLLNVSRGPGSNFKGTGCSNATVTCTLNDTIFSKSNTIAGNHYIIGGTATWTPLPQLTNRLSVGFDYNNTDLRTINPYGFLRVPAGTYYQTLWNRSLMSVDYVSTWKQSFGSDFTSNTSVGGQLFDSRLYSVDLQADNFAGPGNPSLMTGATKAVTDANDQRVINAGVFAQQMFGWRDKLFVTAGLRIDGNSAFGKSFGLQQYPKISASYVLSDEKFWPFAWMETFKLRAAIGESGKAPGAFDAVKTWNPISAEGSQPAFTPGQLGNPNLGPERTRETEGGFDASFFGGRMGLVVTAFKSRTSAALINIAYPPSQGFTNNQPENVGALQNVGFEAQLTGTTQLTRWAELSGRLQYTSIKSKAIDLGGQILTIDALSRSYVKAGLPVPAYMGVKVRNPGDFAAPVVDSMQYLGATFPDQIINPAITLTLFNNFTMEAVGEFQLGGHLLNAIGYANAGLKIWQPCFEAQRALTAAAAGDASKLATVNALDRARCSITSAERDYSYWVESSDFFKLRSISMSYDLPKQFNIPGTRKTSLQLTGRNLFVNTKYTGSDPEVADQRTSTFSRRDYYVFPPYRTFLFSVRTSF